MEKLKFKRGTIPKDEILNQAFKLGLRNEPSFIGSNCCFINNDYIIFGEIGSTNWNSSDYREISENNFMELTKL
jgi:hypothetical protein